MTGSGSFATGLASGGTEATAFVAVETAFPLTLQSEYSTASTTGTNTMTETVTIDRLPIAKPVSRRRSTKPATVSASALALHLDCSRTYIGKLEAEGVIQRQGDGFPLDQSRVAYLRYLRRERRRSPRAEADAEHAKAKTELLQVRIEEKYLAAPMDRRDCGAVGFSVIASEAKESIAPRRRHGLLRRCAPALTI